MTMLATALALTALGASSWTNVDARLRVADPALALSRFENYPNGAAKDVFRPNQRFWATNFDFSCASPWNSQGGSTRAGTLSSKRHIVFAKHFPLAVGTRLVFVDNAGGVCPCHLDAVRFVEGADIAVGLLNAEVTPNIHPAKILPPDAAKYIGTGEGLAVGTFNQREMLYATEMNAMPTNGPRWGHMRCHVPKESHWQPFRNRLIGGDSGNPAFLLIGNEPILIYCLTGGWSGSGPPIHLYRNKVQQAMDDLCPGYTLEEFDFTKVGATKKGDAR